jgi:hypothetical protein
VRVVHAQVRGVVNTNTREWGKRKNRLGFRLTACRSQRIFIAP